MPSQDLSLTYRLMNTGMSAGFAVDVNAAIVALVNAGTPVAAITSGTIAGTTINNSSIGATTPSTVKATQLQAGTFTDISGTPGNGTSSGLRGRAAFAAAASTVVVTSAIVTATSSIFPVLEGAADATLTSIVGITPGAGSFTVTGNAAATAAKTFSFLVIN